MTNSTITERQRYWRAPVLSAAAHSGTIVEYAEATILTKNIYQLKTALTKRGFLPIEKEPPTKDFIAVQSASDWGTLGSFPPNYYRLYVRGVDTKNNRSNWRSVDFTVK